MAELVTSEIKCIVHRTYDASYNTPEFFLHFLFAIFLHIKQTLNSRRVHHLKIERKSIVNYMKLICIQDRSPPPPTNKVSYIVHAYKR